MKQVLREGFYSCLPFFKVALHTSLLKKLLIFLENKMPHLKIETNVPREKIPADLVKTLCQVVATTLGKPLNVSTSVIICN